MPRVISIGRLDLTSEGLLLLTNDGALARRLELPATGWLRRYRVRVHGGVSPDKIKRLADGMVVEGVRYGPIEAHIDSVQRSNTWLAMSLREGKNREIRRVMEALRTARHAAHPRRLRAVPARHPAARRASRKSTARCCASRCRAWANDHPTPSLRAQRSNPSCPGGCRKMDCRAGSQ